MEENEKNEFTEISEDDLEAVSGACNSSDGYTCKFCNNSFSGTPNHIVLVPRVGKQAVCDGCYEAHKHENWHWE